MAKSCHFGKKQPNGRPKIILAHWKASFSASPAQADSQQPDSSSVSALKQSMIRVQPHALDNHVPALCGPLQASHHHALCVCML